MILVNSYKKMGRNELLTDVLEDIFPFGRFLPEMIFQYFEVVYFPC